MHDARESLNYAQRVTLKPFTCHDGSRVKFKADWGKRLGENGLHRLQFASCMIWDQFECVGQYAGDAQEA